MIIDSARVEIQLQRTLVILHVEVIYFSVGTSVTIPAAANNLPDL